MAHEEEVKALNNAIAHFELPFILINKYFSDSRKRTKFFLVLGEETHISSPILAYNEMNCFILGMGMAKEYIK
jgi:hypothetical protein